jgi:hypothetical protein
MLALLNVPHAASAAATRQIARQCRRTNRRASCSTDATSPG